MKVSYIQTFFVIVIGFLFSNSALADNLDNGIYWYGNGDTYVKHVPGKTNPNFDKTKPTIIFAHGWQNGGMVKGTHESFNYRRMSSKFADVDTADKWIKEGWNIGAFYWREFADEGIVMDAENKIWSPYGFRGMRMRNTNGSYSDAPNSIRFKKSVSDLFFEAYVNAMSGYTGNDVRLAGHSLGNQLVIATSKKINDAVNRGELKQNLRPERIALLDPFYSNVPQWFLGGKTTGQKAYEYANQLRSDGVILEYYQNSAVIAVGQIMGTVIDNDSLNKLKNISAYQNMRPWYIPAVDIGTKHLSAHYTYFLSFASPPPAEVTLGKWTGPWWARYYDPFIRVDTGKDAMSAATPNSRVRDMMYNSYYWDQVEGRYSSKTSDDQFQRKRK